MSTVKEDILPFNTVLNFLQQTRVWYEGFRYLTFVKDLVKNNPNTPYTHKWLGCSDYKNRNPVITPRLESESAYDEGVTGCLKAKGDKLSFTITITESLSSFSFERGSQRIGYEFILDHVPKLLSHNINQKIYELAERRILREKEKEFEVRTKIMYESILKEFA